MTTVASYTPYQGLFAAAKGITDNMPAIGPLLSALHTAVKEVEDQTKFRDENPGLIAEAREAYADDETEIDDHPMLVDADEGVWVSAWVWVAAELTGEST